jgi:hypothetical protein
MTLRGKRKRGRPRTQTAEKKREDDRLRQADRRRRIAEA